MATLVYPTDFTEAGTMTVLTGAPYAAVGSGGQYLKGNTGTYYGVINKKNGGSAFAANVANAIVEGIVQQVNTGASTYAFLVARQSIASGSPAGGVVTGDFTGGSCYSLRVKQQTMVFDIRKGALNATSPTILATGSITGTLLTGAVGTEGKRVCLVCQTEATGCRLTAYEADSTTPSIANLSSGWRLLTTVVDATPLAAGGFGYGARSSGTNDGGAFDNVGFLKLA